jgi:F-type H+-transporting ATPase subunit b
MDILLTFAATESGSAGGLGALGINLQSFLFQLITFVIVLVILRKFVYGRLVDTLEARRKAVMDSLAQADESAKQLEAAEKKVAALIKEARGEAENIVAVAHKEATKMVEEAEEKATKRAEHIVENAEARLAQDVNEARAKLHKETAMLVAAATEKVLRQKLDDKSDKQLIETAIKEAA